MRIILSFLYLAFSLLALPQAACGSGGEEVAHSCCCASSGSCSPNSPMDCCVDDGDELPPPAQIPVSQFSLETPLVSDIETIFGFETQIPNPKSQISNPDEAPGRVKTYIAYHQLVFYA
jgi:hypothetical protein